MHGSACVIRDIYVTVHSVFGMPAGTPVRGVCGHVFCYLSTKNELDKEIKERRAEAQRYERRVQQKEENIDKKADAIEKREASLASREETLNRMKDEVSKLNEQRAYAGVSTAILIFTKTEHGGTDDVWFYDMTADGF